ncbi:hypothetical protein ACLB2K_052019 [Fragaria x ananassa]
MSHFTSPMRLSSSLIKKLKNRVRAGSNPLLSQYRSFTAIEGHRPVIVHKRSLDILHDPWFNKGTSFSITERDRLDLRGLLPPNVMTSDQQIERFSIMWREIKLLAASKPVIASMWDAAASGGYYMAMATDAIVAENLTLTGSIGVVTGKFNLGKLYEMIGFNKEIISRGNFAEVLAAEQRPFRPEEAELFAKSAQNSCKQFRDKAASSRSMTVCF